MRVPRLLSVLIVGLTLRAASAAAQSPELSMREFASGQIKKGVRSIGFGGDGATWGNYALVTRDAGTALVDYGLTRFTDGNQFTFTAVGFTSPALWHGLTVYAIAMSQHASDIALDVRSPGLGDAPRSLVGQGADQAVFSKIALPLDHGVSVGVLLSYELSSFDAITPPGDPAPAHVRYATEWRPSGGAGVTWQPGPRLLFGARAILNHDREVRSDPAGVASGLARTFEGRLGGSVSPWPGGLLDLGATYLDRHNGLAGTTKRALHPNVGAEQVLVPRHLVARAGVDETSPGGGVSVLLAPLRLDVAYVYGLGRARVGDLFGTTSHSVLATLTYDYRPPSP